MNVLRTLLARLTGKTRKAAPSPEPGVWTYCDFCGEVMADPENPGFKVCGKCMKDLHA